MKITGIVFSLLIFFSAESHSSMVNYDYTFQGQSIVNGSIINGHGTFTVDEDGRFYDFFIFLNNNINPSFSWEGVSALSYYSLGTPNDDFFYASGSEHFLKNGDASFDLSIEAYDIVSNISPWLQLDKHVGFESPWFYSYYGEIYGLIATIHSPAYLVSEPDSIYLFSLMILFIFLKNFRITKTFIT